MEYFLWGYLIFNVCLVFYTQKVLDFFWWAEDNWFFQTALFLSLLPTIIVAITIGNLIRMYDSYKKE